jgi:Tfp pilus assembly protein PilN
MIKVNLLVNKAREANQAGAEGGVRIGSGGGAAKAAGGQRDAVVKALLVIGAVGLLYGYENYHVEQLKVLSAQALLIRDQKLAEKNALEQENKKYLKHQQTVKEMDEKLRILGDIAKRRLGILKALDQLQNFIPQRVWLQSFRYGGSQASGGAGEVDQSVEIRGAASSQEDLDQFLERLEASQVFADIVPVNQTQNQTQAGAFIEFVFRGKLTGGGS